jgi:hypothetical protein
MKYSASMDKMAKTVTVAVTILFASIIILQYALVSNGSIATPIIITIFLLAIYFCVFLFRPMGYSITSDGIVIHRLWGDVKMDKNQISSVELIEKEKLRWSLRTFGVGGLFGYFGKFANAKLGTMTWYITRRDHPVLIVTSNNKKIIISPDEAEKFVSDFKK